MRQYILIGLCTLIKLMTVEGFAQESVVTTRTSRTGFHFLQLSNNARTIALGEAGVGMIGSGEAILYNPAGLAFMEGREAYFTYVNWIMSVKQYVAGVAANVPRIGTFGLSVVNHDRDPVWVETSTQEISDYAISAAYGSRITNRISVGTTLKLIHQGYPKQNVFAFDLGTYFATGLRNTVIAMGVENVSTSALGEPEQFGLPKNVRLGVILDLIALTDVSSRSHALDLNVDVNNPIGFVAARVEQVGGMQFRTSEDGFSTGMGIEYTYLYHTAKGRVLGVSLRGGYQSRPPTGMGSNTLGIGVRFSAGDSGLEVDYTSKFVGYVFDERVHILSVAFGF